MVSVLNPVSFQQFGIISNDASVFDVTKINEIISLSQEVATVYHAQGQVRLTPDPGLCVLSVSRDNVHFEHFYLDKIVILKQDLYFYLTSFGSHAITCSGDFTPVGALTEHLDFRVHPKLGLPRVYTFFYQEREQGFVFTGESHSMYELTYVDKGSLHCVLEGQDLLLQPGDMALCLPEQWHMHYADTGVAPSYVTVSFDVEGLDAQHLANRSFRSPQKAIDLLRHMLREQERNDPYCEDVILGLLRQLLLVLVRQGASQETSVRNPQGFHNENAIILRAQQYISENVRKKLSVPVVAQNTGVSASYLTSLFHKHLQISPGEYIRRVKLQESKQMIRESNLNFSQIAAALQYSTIHHFSRSFKEKYGITPTQYAKSVK